MLKAIGGGFQLEESAANAWLKLEAAAEAEGFTVRVNSAYRSPEKQKALFSAYVKAMAMWMRTGSVPEEKPKPVAKPGTSEHEHGIAVDINVKDEKLLRWLLLNSTTYGFWLSAARELWHYSYYPDGPPPHLRERHLSNLRTFGAAG
jgi:LAS superfamily LD-carboxypeptidase LdcB